jgi:polysaccharide deacetylase 2 family uncharacterized protein YibQ
MVAGGLVSVAALSVASVLAPLPGAPTVDVATPDVAAPERVTVTGSGKTGSDTDSAVQTEGAVQPGPAPAQDTLTALNGAARDPAVAPRAGVDGDFAAPQVAVVDPDVSDGVTAGGREDGAIATNGSVQPTPAPEQDTLAAVDAARDPVRVPQTGTAEDLAAPEVPEGAGGVSLQGEEPVLPNPQALAPMAPQGTDDLPATVEVSRPPAPVAETDGLALADPGTGGTAPQVPGGEGAAPAAEPVETALLQPEAEETPAITPDRPAVPRASVDATAPELPEAPERGEGQPGVNAGIAEAAPEGTEAPAAVPVPAPGSAPDPDTEPAAAPAPEPEDDTPQVAMVVPEGGQRIGTPATSLIGRETDVVVRRPGAEEPAPEAAVDAPTEPRRPLDAFAQPFTPEDDKPLMSIVLIDDGTTPVSGAAGLSALDSFPYPLTFAVDSSLPDAAARMALYRAAGAEVLAMIDLPDGARPEDVETTFAATLPKLPEVVGVLGAPSGNLQSGREVSDQVAQILAASGHGWVTQAKGLNTAATLARREGVPAAAIFRDFDSKDQTAVVIRRFLDQAAFKAGRESGVIMLGRMRPETVSALLLWSLQDRAGQVALAPISAVLRATE